MGCTPSNHMRFRHDPFHTAVVPMGPYPAFEAWGGSQFATEADDPFWLLQRSRQPARCEEPPPYSEFAMEGHVSLMESPLQVSNDFPSHTADSVLPPMDMQGHRSSMELMQESGTYTDTDLDTSFLEESGGSPLYQRSRSLDRTPANNVFVRRTSLPYYGLHHSHFQEEPLSRSAAIFPTRPGASSTVQGTFSLPVAQDPLPPLHTYPVSNSVPPIMSRLPQYRPPPRLPPLQQQQDQIDRRQRKKRRRKRGHTWHGEGLPVPLQ